MILRVRYNKIFATALLSISVVLLVMRIVLYYFTDKFPLFDFAVCLFLLYAGWSYLTGTFFELHNDKIVTYILGGPIKKNIGIGSVSNLIFSGTDLFLTYNGKRKKIPVGPFMSNKEDWHAFRVFVEQQKPGGELHEL